VEQVAGYVRDVGRQGAFVEIGRDLVARVRLSNLSQGFVEDPVAAFPVGQLVRGRVLSIAPGR
jgi:rRNA biogenesis protein RRP5